MGLIVLNLFFLDKSIKSVFNKNHYVYRRFKKGVLPIFISVSDKNAQASEIHNQSSKIRSFERSQLTF